MSAATQSRKKSRSLRLAMEAADWFFANSLDVFLIVRDGIIEQASPSLSNFLGWTEGEGVGKSFQDFVHPKDMQVVLTAVERLNATGQAEYEHRALTKTGDWRWCRVRIKRAGDGASIVIMQDISAERRRLQEEAETDSAYRLLQAASGVSLWRYHPLTDECEYDPDFALPFLETPPGKRIPLEVARGGVHLEDARDVEAAWRRTVRSGALQMVEFRERSEAGEWRRMRSAWMGVRQHHGGGWEVVGVSQDLTELMTERDRAVRGEEAARAAAEAKSQFLANISHELRTPMNGVLGTLYLVRNASSDDERIRLIDEAINAGGDLSRLLGDIVDYADADAGRVGIDPVPVDVADLVEGVCGPFREQAADKGLAFHISNEVAGSARLDPARVRQVLGCLLSNALKFTTEGRVDVRVSQIGAGAEAQLEFEVEDTGVGIAEGKQAALFGQFHQADGSATRRFGGVGLGLARARALVELMGGSIAFTSVEGFGSVFRVSIEAPACEGVGLFGDQPLAGLKVLLVEDNATNRLVGSRMLESLGAAVVCAENGEAGVEAAIAGGFDLIFMDIQMPVMDGIAATRILRQRHGPVAMVPIIAMTANVLDHQLRAYAEAGMNGCIAKPISPAAMIAEIARLADGPVTANVA